MQDEKWLLLSYVPFCAHTQTHIPVEKPLHIVFINTYIPNLPYTHINIINVYALQYSYIIIYCIVRMYTIHLFVHSCVLYNTHDGTGVKRVMVYGVCVILKVKLT